MPRKLSALRNVHKGNNMRYALYVVLVVALALGYVGLLESMGPDTIQKVDTRTVLEVSIDQTIGSVVHIANLGAGCQGSGFLVTPRIVATARHVVVDGNDFVVTLNDGKEIKSSKALKFKTLDIGFLLLDEPVGTMVPIAKVGTISDLRLGEQVYAIGSPYGKVNVNSVTLGIISRLNCGSKYPSLWAPEDYGWPKITFQTDTNGEPGNSGCPVFSLDGVVRGVLVGGFSNGIIYCIPADVFMDELQAVKTLFQFDQFEFVRVQDRLEPPRGLDGPAYLPVIPKEPNAIP
jgi:S1-C subfamily serine protease